MLAFIVSVLASLAILFGSADVPYVEATISTSTQQQQDTDVLLEDVWQTVDDYDITNKTNAHMMLEYVGSTTQPVDELPRGQFALSSLDLTGTSHIMQWTVLHTV
jgi:hypothetical protein